MDSRFDLRQKIRRNASWRSRSEAVEEEMMGQNRWLLGILGILMLAACEEVTGEQGAATGSLKDDFKSQLTNEEQGKVLARIDDRVITLVDFERHLAAQPPYARARFASSPERQKEFLDNLVRFEVLANEAQRRGYHRHPEVLQAMKQTMVRKMMSGDVQDIIKLSDVSEEEMNQYYVEHKTEYHKPEEARVSHILVKTQAEAEAALAKLTEQIGKDKANYRKIFADLAKELSLDTETKDQGGDLRFFARVEDGGTQPKALADAAFAIPQVGNLGPIVQTEKGFHVILLTGKKNKYDREFEQVKRQIQNRLYREKKRKATDDFVEGLRKAAKVERHDDLLAKIKPDLTESPAGPGPVLDATPPLPGQPGLLPGAGSGLPGRMPTMLVPPAAPGPAAPAARPANQPPTQGSPPPPPPPPPGQLEPAPAGSR